MASYSHQDPNRRRDGSQASKAKSNKTIDYQHVLQNQFQPFNRMQTSLFPNLNYLNIIPPIEQYERLINQVPPLLTKFINRRKCESKNKQQQRDRYVDVTFCRFNKDGRFLFVGSDLGIIYLYNSYDFSFHYQYYLQARPQTKLNAIAFHPNNSNQVYTANKLGQISFYENLLHYDLSQEKHDLEVSKVELLALNCSPCGEQLLTCDTTGKIITVDCRAVEYARRNQPRGTIDEFEAFKKQCQDCCYQSSSKQLILACSDEIRLMDQRVKKDERVVARQDYLESSKQQINKVRMHRNGNLILAAGSDGARIFDIRNLSTERYQPLYTVKPQTEVSEGKAIMFHPIHSNIFLVGDKEGNINYYDLNFTNASLGVERLFVDDSEYDVFRNQVMQTVELFNCSQLYSVGSIKNAHRSNNGKGMEIIDFDIHPSGNSLGTIAADKDVRFWTYPGAGNVYQDIFHDGNVDPVDQEFQFNQSHRELQEQESLLEIVRDEIERMPRRRGEDIYTREEVQDKMKKYINIADERLRDAQEAGYFEVK